MYLKQSLNKINFPPQITVLMTAENKLTWNNLSVKRNDACISEKYIKEINMAFILVIIWGKF